MHYCLATAISTTAGSATSDVSATDAPVATGTACATCTTAAAMFTAAAPIARTASENDAAIRIAVHVGRRASRMRGTGS